MIRLTGSYASLLAISHDMSARSTVAFVIRARKDEHDLIKGTLQRNRHLLGHPLLVPALLMGISMSSNFERVQILQVELANVEHSTGQHDWQNIPVADAPRHDGELSRRGHSAKIAVAFASRLVDAVRACLLFCKKHRLSSMMIFPSRVCRIGWWASISTNFYTISNISSTFGKPILDFCSDELITRYLQ